MLGVVERAAGFTASDVTGFVPLDGPGVDERLLQDGQDLQVGRDHEAGRLLSQASGPDDVRLVQLEPHFAFILLKKGHV